MERSVSFREEETEKEMDAPSEVELKNISDLSKIRGLSVGAAILHVAVTVGVMQMGFTKNSINGQKYSETIVLAAFGCVITCIWASVGSWEIFEGSMKEHIPTWEWHNDHFNTAVGVVFSLTFFLWPSIIIHVIHTEGGNFFDLVFDIESSLVGPLIFHFVSFPLSFVVNVLAIIVTTKTLKNFQLQEFEADEEEQEVEQKRPGGLNRFVMMKVATDVLLIINLSIVTVTLKGNSGTVLSILFQIVCTIAFAFYGRKLKKAPDVEVWAFQWRAITMFYLFMSWVVFWINIGMLVLVGHQRVDFWEALQNSNSIVVYCEVGFFALYMVVYSLLFKYHQRCMNAMDELDSLKLIELHITSDDAHFNAKVMNSFDAPDGGRFDGSVEF